MDVEKSFSKGDLSLNFLVSRSHAEVRQGYLNKLLANKMLKMEPSKKYQSSKGIANLVIIFDWDDTLLCTSYLSGFQFLELSVDAKTLVKSLDDYAVILRLTSVETSLKGQSLWKPIHYHECCERVGRVQ